MLTVNMTIMTITGRSNAMLTVIVTITRRSVSSVSSYCDNNDNNEESYMQC